MENVKFNPHIDSLDLDDTLEWIEEVLQVKQIENALDLVEKLGPSTRWQGGFRDAIEKLRKLLEETLDELGHHVRGYQSELDGYITESQRAYLSERMENAKDNWYHVRSIDTQLSMVQNRLEN